MMKNAPCKDCHDRHPNCHSQCEEYRKYRHDLDLRNEHIHKQKHEEAIFWGSKKNDTKNKS
jgi:hypothetical protein